ncbi:hypothetical protein [Paraherbaspirillum soli]|uniref:DUF3806 domain-containing protein n=1 Tax=Paraherbaspirillum soli TaxID=631222 RepID=A0ABW0M5B8_9BURK
MKKNVLLEFESAAFADSPGADQHTNPGVVGKALAQWLAEQLRAQGLIVGQVVAEDFGWLVPVEAKPHLLFVACANAEETNNRWRVFTFAESGLLSRLFGRDNSAEPLAFLFAAVKQALQSDPAIQGLREVAA